MRGEGIAIDSRERMLRVLRSAPTDKVAWTTLADDVTRQPMPREYREADILDFYRMIGCDILQFGCYGLPDDVVPKYPFEVDTDVRESVETMPNGTVVTKRTLGSKALETTARNGHPVKYPVTTEAELAIFLDMVESSRVRLVSDGCAESLLRCEEAIARDGVFVPISQPSPVQQLIENECGPASFYYLLSDCPELMERVMDAMFERKRLEYEIMAEHMPGETVIPVENTSTALISPALYRKYTLPHMQAYAAAMRRHGKKAIIHMCGHLKNLLPELKEIGLDGIHALTPPQLGDCPFELALDALGEELIIIGSLPAEVFQNPSVGAGEIREQVKRLLTPRIKAANFVLWPVVDGIRTEVWRLLAIRDAVDEFGQK